MALDNKAAHVQRAAMRNENSPKYRPQISRATDKLAQKKQQEIFNGSVPQTIEERLFIAANAREQKKVNLKARYDLKEREDAPF